MPRSRPNSRVKDLPDLALIATAEPLNSTRLRAAIEQTFSFRGTHGVPRRLPHPPPAWEQPYAALARTDGLRWPTLEDWNPATWTWAPPTDAEGPSRE